MSPFRLSLLAIAACAALRAQTIPNFIPPSAHLSGVTAYWSAAADFNGDGLVDLAAPDGTGTSLGFFYALAKPGGGYTLANLRVVGSVVQMLQAADFNNDGRADLLLTTPSGASVMLSNTAGGFASPLYAALPGTPSYAASGDFNADGKIDIVTAVGTGFAVSLGTGAGTFLPATLLPQLSTYYVITGDFNNDGKLDFAGPVGTGGVTYLGNGNGAFQPPVSTVAIPALSIVADFNNDGFPDLAYLTAQPRQDGSNHAINIARGMGNGQFAPYSGYVTGVPMSSLAAGDFNADGRMDIAAWISSTSKVRVFAGNGGLTIGGDLIDSPAMPNGVLLAADIDGNGSKDLIHSWNQEFRTFRSTHGNPPLLAQVKLDPPSVIGGAANATATVTLGGAAPAGGVIVTLSTTDPSLASFPAGPAVSIPAGAASATFQVTTVPVPGASFTNILASAAGVTQTARLDLVAPYALTGVAINPGSQYGSFTVQGIVTLSGPADASAVITLTSANPALAAVPPSVTVPAGAASATFPITLQAVAASTATSVTASMGGMTHVSTITILRPLDSVAVSKSLLTTKSAQLKVEATSTGNPAAIEVYSRNTGSLLGTLTGSGGKYGGTMFAPSNTTSILLRSALGGTIIAAVQPK